MRRMNAMAAVAAVGLAAILILAAPHASGTEVTMKDGNVFVGETVSQTDAAIVLDAKLGSGRAKLTIVRDRIASVKEGPVPEGFFDQPKPEGPKPAPGSFAPSDQLYLEVPVTGRFGEDVFASGIERAISYAKEHRVQHLVFTIDSQDSTNMDEARKVFQVLEKASEDFSYHAVVRQATGDSLGVLMPCNTIHVLPGARLGGAAVRPKEGEDPDEVAVMLRQRAQRVGRVAERLGRSPELVRAMIDPTEKLTCWLGEDGKPVLGVDAPADVAADRVVFACPAGQVLVLTSDQMRRMGVPVLEGSVDKLGAQLGLPAWKPESDFGRQVMAKAAEAEQATIQAKRNTLARKAEMTLGRRKAAKDALAHAIAQAAKWDPDKGQYATYGGAGTWGLGSADNSSNRLTVESRQRWAQRTDMTIGYIGEALKTIKVIKDLEARAAGIGLEPLYAQGELDRLAKDLEARRLGLRADRDRKEK